LKSRFDHSHHAQSRHTRAKARSASSRKMTRVSINLRKKMDFRIKSGNDT
jgi:hypothetical protein